MLRFDRPPFDFKEIVGLRGEARTRLQFDWLRDDGDREKWLDALGGRLHWIGSRAPVQDDPAPPRSLPAPQGRACVALISDPTDVDHALTTPSEFSNLPYAELGGAGFMLAMDPPRAGTVGTDWHREQRDLANQVLAYSPVWLAHAATESCKQAALLSLRAREFDLAEWAEQAALRYFGLLFGFGARDHLLLEDAARTGYRALQYIIIGRHFTSEPGTLPAAQHAMANLATRSAALMDEYTLLHRSPRTPLSPSQIRPGADWPEGVQPWGELCLASLGEPVLKKLAGAGSPLNGQDRCSIVSGLLVGTVGNVQTAGCQMVEHLLGQPAVWESLKKAADTKLAEVVTELLGMLPPVSFLPRRTLEDVTLRGKTIPAGTDCILALRSRTGTPLGCPHAWGSVLTKKGLRSVEHAIHPCLGREFIEPLLVALLRETLKLPGLAERLDGLNGETLKPERLWGMGCMRYLLQFDREKVRVQQPLIVMMRVKSPLPENAERLRQVVRCGAPRIEWALRNSQHVHFAWFEFLENDSLLALHTLYDGDFDAYIQHFALKVGDLFDQLFACIEGAPPSPVAEHPNEFIEAIRRSCRAPLGGYFFSAYPRAESAQIVRAFP